jgi:hypothetical protein
MAIRESSLCSQDIFVSADIQAFVEIRNRKIMLNANPAHKYGVMSVIDLPK